LFLAKVGFGGGGGGEGDRISRYMYCMYVHCTLHEL
jgi:hypothetical protein